MFLLYFTVVSATNNQNIADLCEGVKYIIPIILIDRIAFDDRDAARVLTEQRRGVLDGITAEIEVSQKGLDLSVAGDLHHLSMRNSGAYHSRRRRMPQIVKMQILDIRPRASRAKRPRRPPARKYDARRQLPGGNVEQHGLDPRRHADLPRLLRFGIKELNGENVAFEIDVRPFELKDLVRPHRRIDGEDDNARQVRPFGRYCHRAAFALALEIYRLGIDARRHETHLFVKRHHAIAFDLGRFVDWEPRHRQQLID